LNTLRESWARSGNRHLERHGFEPTLDHRNLEAQGIEREPTLHMGKSATAIEREGNLSELGGVNRRQVRDVLRLKTAGLSGNEIARRVGIAPSTVRLTLKRLADAGLGWPLPAEITDTALEAQLFAAVGKKQGHRRLAEPDWAAVHRELKRKHVTLQILWDEYIERNRPGTAVLRRGGGLGW
jgi:MobA/MobL family/Winged helix-turn-helix DNA-binding